MSDWTPIMVEIHMGDPEIDALGPFEAYTRGDLWNGWATPYFTRSEGGRVANWAAAMSRKFGPEGVILVRWDEARSAFVMEDPEYPHEPGQLIPEVDVIRGVSSDLLDEQVYGIGAYAWTWSIVTTGGHPSGLNGSELTKALHP